MAEILLFHHAQGLTSGCVSLADQMRRAGHVVHVPDLYEGKMFADLAAGIAHAEAVGFDTIVERGRRSSVDLPTELVYIGLSLGVLPAQMLAQTRPGARGAMLLHACVPPAEFGAGWPEYVPLQIHVMEDDDLGDVDVAREVAATIQGAELFLYPGERHLFTDSSVADYDPAAARLVERRILAFLAGVDAA